MALYLVLRDVHWREVGDAIRAADYLLIGLAVLIFLGVVLFRSMRWRLLLGSPASLTVGHLFGSLNVAYLVNNLLPLQMGDLARSYLVSELGGISATRAVSTVVVEKVADVLTLLLFLVLIAPFVSIPNWALAPSLLLAAAFTTLAFLLVLAAIKRRLIAGLIEKLLRLSPDASRPKLRQMAESGLDGVQVFRSPRLAIGLVAYSSAIWLLAATVLFLGMEAFSLGTSFGAAVLVLVATTFGIFVPSSPGAFGVYHAIAIGTLTSVFGLGKNLAVSYALVIHLVVYLPPLFLGTAFLWLERRLWRQTSFFEKLGQLRGRLETVAAGSSNADVAQ